MIRPATPDDAAAICRIYNPYVIGTTITFEEQEVSVDEMARRIEGVAQQRLPWLVIEREGKAVGYSYASRWRPRSAYRFSAEASVYVDSAWHRRGLGRLLYTRLIAELAAAGIHRVIGGAALPNEASAALHEALGFRKVAHFEEVGFKFGRWIDVGYWELSVPNWRSQTRLTTNGHEAAAPQPSESESESESGSKGMRE